MDQKCLTAEQVAQTMGIGRTFVYQLIKEGRLESIKLGRRRLVPLQAIEDLIAREREQD